MTPFEIKKIAEFEERLCNPKGGLLYSVNSALLKSFLLQALKEQRQKMADKIKMYLEKRSDATDAEVGFQNGIKAVLSLLSNDSPK
jgi:hypothetical protein